jgi:hypothetical protein
MLAKLIKAHRVVGKFSFSTNPIEQNEETIDIKSVKNESEKITISDMYTIKSKKLGPRNAANFIDKTRITNQNVTLYDEFDKEVFSKDDFETMNPIPVSSRLGPFEVLLFNLDYKTTVGR